jgi:hypothetical protein
MDVPEFVLNSGQVSPTGMLGFLITDVFELRLRYRRRRLESIKYGWQYVYKPAKLFP